MTFSISNQIGLGGVALGNVFRDISEADAERSLNEAWERDIRYYDTAPLYGLGVSEERFGRFLATKKRSEYLISTKVGRIVYGGDYRYDFTEEGTRLSLQHSLKRLGLDSIEFVFVHDLSPDNRDLSERWVEHFNVAVTGAFPALSRMREEGIIKGWGLGVNSIEPLLKAAAVSDPDIFLLATKYSLLEHTAAIQKLFPLLLERDISLVVGAPFNSGILAGQKRFNYKGVIAPEITAKVSRMQEVALRYNVNLRSAALQFVLAPEMVCAVIPGAGSPRQIQENVNSLNEVIPPEFWDELKATHLIAQTAPTPRGEVMGPMYNKIDHAIPTSHGH